MSVYLQEVQTMLDEAKALLSPSNVYPYYHRAVHLIVCQSTVASLGWLTCFQAPLGLFCLPVLAVGLAWTLEAFQKQREVREGVSGRDFIEVSREDIQDMPEEQQSLLQDDPMAEIVDERSRANGRIGKRLTMTLSWRNDARLELTCKYVPAAGSYTRPFSISASDPSNEAGTVELDR